MERNQKDTKKVNCSKKTTNYHHGNLKEELLKEAVQIIQTKNLCHQGQQCR